MSDRRLLYYTADSHSVYLWQSGKLQLEGVYGVDDEGVSEFLGFAKQRPNSLYYILADLAGEDFHDEMIPWLRGGDRQAVIERRLAQRYRDTRLAAALSLGQVNVAGERRNERLLLSSFTNTQQFSPWLDALSEAGAKLAGVYSVPLVAPALAARLAAKIGAKSSHTIVVSINSAGLRQSFLEDGRLRFARLERIGEMTPDSLAAFVRSETLRLVQYLSSLRVLPRDAPPLTAIVIAPAGQRAIFEEMLVSDGRLTFRIVELPEAARITGVKRAEGIGAEQLYLHLLAKSSPKEQFARTEDRKGFLLWQLRRGVVAAGALGFAACALFAGAKWLDVWSVLDHAEQQRTEALVAEQEYKRVTATFPVTQTSTENLKITVNEFRDIGARTAAPDPAFIYVSRALERFPLIELERLAWKVDVPKSTDKNTPIATAATSAAGSAPVAVTQLLEISGYVTNTQRSDYRAITALVQSFSDALQVDPAYRVERTQLPFDTTSKGTLSGDIGTVDNGGTPRFTIVLSRRIRK
jgi:hypothetical protein